MFLKLQYLYFLSSLLVKSCDRFTYTARSRDCLPAGFPEDIPGTCYFLDGYTPTQDDPIDRQLFFAKEVDADVGD